MNCYKEAIHKWFPLSSEATNGMKNFEIAKKDSNAKIYKNLQNLNNEKEINILKSLGAKDNDSGIIYDEHSYVAKQFENSPEIEAHLAKIREDVLHNRPLQDFDIRFESTKNDLFKNNSNIDRHAFIHYAKVIDQNVDENGIYTCKILDYSDFKNQPIKDLLDIPNKWGYDMQEKKIYKNFYIIIHIRKKVKW